jgi:cephalosporin hydroxylase
MNVQRRSWSAKKVRFLFIDGDHTRAGVENDIRLFFPLLVEGAIVVFDDFTGDFPGLVDALDRLVADSDFSRIFALEKTLVLKV